MISGILSLTSFSVIFPHLCVTYFLEQQRPVFYCIEHMSLKVRKRTNISKVISEVQTRLIGRKIFSVFVRKRTGCSSLTSASQARVPAFLTTGRSGHLTSSTNARSRTARSRRIVDEINPLCARSCGQVVVDLFGEWLVQSERDSDDGLALDRRLPRLGGQRRYPAEVVEV